MKVSLGKIWNSRNALVALTALKNLPIKTSYWVANKSKKLLKEIEAVEERRKELVEKLGVKDDKGNTSVPQEKMDEFLKELNVLLDTEIDVPIKQFSIEEFQGVSGISGKEMMDLDYLFEETSPENIKPTQG